MSKDKNKYTPCPKCGHEKVLFANRFIQEFDVDQEPYCSGEIIQGESREVFTQGVMLCITYCEKCDTILDSWTDYCNRTCNHKGESQQSK